MGTEAVGGGGDGHDVRVRGVECLRLVGLQVADLQLAPGGLS